MKYHYEDYKTWITNYITSLGGTPQDARGQCMEAVDCMHEAFPELIRVYGHVHTKAGPKIGHWWCETELGAIIDPTRIQFGQLVVYLPRYRFLLDGDTWCAWTNRSIHRVLPGPMTGDKVASEGTALGDGTSHVQPAFRPGDFST